MIVSVSDLRAGDVFMVTRGPGWFYHVEVPEAVAYPLAGHAGACAKVTRAQTHGKFDGICNCGTEPNNPC